MLLGVAVVLAAAAPTHASRADGYGNRCAMRGEKLPAKQRLGGSDTGSSLSKRYYGSHGGALTILWSNGLKRWPPSTRIVASKRYRVGDTIVIPKLPTASIKPPQRSNDGMKERRT
jgi:hypothetical protein